MAKKIKVQLDDDICIGNAMCRAAAPDSFEARPNGQSRVHSRVNDDLEVLLEAAASCPVVAITILDEDSGQVIEPPW